MEAGIYRYGPIEDFDLIVIPYQKTDRILLVVPRQCDIRAEMYRFFECMQCFGRTTGFTKGHSFQVPGFCIMIVQPYRLCEVSERFIEPVQVDLPLCPSRKGRNVAGVLYKDPVKGFYRFIYPAKFHKDSTPASEGVDIRGIKGEGFVKSLQGVIVTVEFEQGIGFSRPLIRIIRSVPESTVIGFDRLVILFKCSI